MAALADAPGTIGIGPATQPTAGAGGTSLPTARELGLAPQSWIESLLPPKGQELNLPSYADTIDRAQAQEMAGQYRQSLFMLYQAQLKNQIKPKDAARVAVVRAGAMLALDRYDDALAVLDAKDLAVDSHVAALRCRVLLAADRPGEAADAARAIIKADGNSIAGHYYLGAALEAECDIPGARDAFVWFAEGPQAVFAVWEARQDQAFDDAANVTLMGRAMDRWATLSGSYPKRPELHDAIFNVFVRAYDVIDREYWPAHLAAAQFCVAHDDTQKAVQELTAALGANPNDPEALDLLGRISLSQFNFDKCDAAVAALRRDNPDSVAADLLECRSLMTQRVPPAAERLARMVMARRPHDRQAMGLLAAALALRQQDAASAAVLADVDRLWPQDASALFEVGDQLAAMRQFDRAAAAYKAAIARAPWWTEPRNQLGLLYTQSGDEDTARPTLQAAHDLDPYNLQTTNYLRLLDELAAFARQQTPHFVIRYDASADPMIPTYFGDYLESIYPAVTGEYQCKPPGPTMIEVFPTHDAFSVRTTGTPWIGTVGASTGRVIALVSPRNGAATLGTYNWSQVLRHEFTHTVTLAATGNRIPLWMTEGLAVYQEQTPLRWEWVPMLYQAVNNDELLTLQNITWSFVRPRRPIDRQLAYAESFWICRFIEETDGHATILKILDGFKAGQTQDEVFPQVLGKSLDSFFADFKGWTQRQVAGWGYDAQTTKKYEALRDQGEQLIQQQNYAQAAAIWEQIALLRPVDELPHQRLAGLYSRSALNQVDKEIAQLLILDAVELKDNRFSKRIARLYASSGKLDEAQRYALRAVYIEPYDLAAHQLLYGLAEQAHDAATADREQKAIGVLQDWKERQAKQADAAGG
jgi:tetratricopeptide (TPR) repeat protein